MNILDKIVNSKKIYLDKYRSNKDLFKSAFIEKKANLIWEIKLASPKFDYSKEIDLEWLIDFYSNNNKISAISNLIDEKYFSWDIKNIKKINKWCSKPVFFKEFIIDKKQIDGASYYWYDWLLLIERILDDDDLIEFLKYSNWKNIFPIIEVDTYIWMKRVLHLKTDFEFWIAINSRNLGTMEIDTKKHFLIYDKYKDLLSDKIVFAFSWIDNLDNISDYVWRFNWVLVGTYFMEQFKNI